MRRFLIILALGLSGCTNIKPIVHWTCAGCQALLSTGTCALGQHPNEKVVVPECKAGEQLVVENWNKVSREGALPILGCEKQ